jgi:D-3-phosphoglycerate dehydrogenase
MTSGDVRRLAVLDTAYGDVDIERAAAAALGVEIIDARPEAAGGAGAAGSSAAGPTDAGSTAAGSAVAGAADGVLVQFTTIGAAEMDANPGWRVIGRYGVGVDTIDLEAATRRGIRVVNVPDYCEEEVATHAAALALSSVRRIPQADRLVRDGGWTKWRGLTPIPALSEATLGVVGLGRIGRETIRLLRPFFGRVVAYDPFVSEAGGDVDALASLETVLAEADVLTLHVPLTSDTHHLIDAAALALMKPGAHLVNVSRGGLVDTAALADALHRGALGGAAVDVLETEPADPDDPLLSAPRAIVTDHIAWYSDRSEPRLRALLAERCAAVLMGAGAPSIVNAAALAAAPATPERTVRA